MYKKSKIKYNKYYNWIYFIKVFTKQFNDTLCLNLDQDENVHTQFFKK